ELAQPRGAERLRGHVVLDAGVGEHDRRLGLGVEALHGALQHHASSVDPVTGSIARSRSRRAVTDDRARRGATSSRSAAVSRSRARPGSSTRTAPGTARWRAAESGPKPGANEAGSRQASTLVPPPSWLGTTTTGALAAASTRSSPAAEASGRGVAHTPRRGPA